jgi:hypothetical protein
MNIRPVTIRSWDAEFSSELDAESRVERRHSWRFHRLAQAERVTFLRECRDAMADTKAPDGFQTHSITIAQDATATMVEYRFVYVENPPPDSKPKRNPFYPKD